MDQKLRTFLEGPAMLIAGVDAGGRAALARVMGVRPTADGTALDLFISRAQWAPVVAHLRAGSWLALTLCRPATYETYQVKGPVEALAPADAADVAAAASYVAATRAHLVELGVELAQMAPWLFASDLMRVRMRPRQMFEQTPGPGAGRELAEPA